MISLQFYRDSGRLKGFTCTGHSGYAEAGADIVCAAVSSAVSLAECIINDVLQYAADVEVDDERARISLTLNDRREGEQILKGLLLQIRQLAQEFPDYITVSEV